MNILFASETEKAEFWLPLLQRALPEETFFVTEQKSIDVALIATPPPGTLGRLKGVKLIQSLWMGVEKLIADPEYPRGVPLAPGLFSTTTV